MKKIIRFLLFIVLVLMIISAQLRFRPWLFILFIFGVCISTFFHETVHAIVYLLYGIRVDGVICSPFAITFHPQFKISILRPQFILSGGEVIPDLFMGKSFVYCLDLTKKSLIIAPLASLAEGFLALTVFIATKNELFFFVFLSSGYIVLSSFISENDVYGDFVAYKKIKGEKLFFLNIYCTNALIIHGGEALSTIYKTFNTLFVNPSLSSLSESEQQNYNNLVFLYVSLKLAGYAISIDEIENNINGLPLTKYSCSEEESLIALRSVCCNKNHSKDELMSLFVSSSQFGDSIQISYLVKQAETFYGIYDNSEYLAEHFSEYVENLDVHNLYFSGWGKLEKDILRKCLSHKCCP